MAADQSDVTTGVNSSRRSGLPIHPRQYSKGHNMPEPVPLNPDSEIECQYYEQRFKPQSIPNRPLSDRG